MEAETPTGTFPCERSIGSLHHAIGALCVQAEPAARQSGRHTETRPAVKLSEIEDASDQQEHMAQWQRQVCHCTCPVGSTGLTGWAGLTLGKGRRCHAHVGVAQAGGTAQQAGWKCTNTARLPCLDCVGSPASCMFSNLEPRCQERQAQARHEVTGGDWEQRVSNGKDVHVRLHSICHTCAGAIGAARGSGASGASGAGEV
jgi:hypothetical protein